MAKKDQYQHWLVERWGDYPRYQCKYCQFDSLDLGEIERHYNEVHKAVPQTQPMQAIILDRYNNPITERQVIVDGTDNTDTSTSAG